MLNFKDASPFNCFCRGFNNDDLTPFYKRGKEKEKNMEVGK